MSERLSSLEKNKNFDFNKQQVALKGGQHIDLFSAAGRWLS